MAVQQPVAQHHSIPGWLPAVVLSSIAALVSMGVSWGRSELSASHMQAQIVKIETRSETTATKVETLSREFDRVTRLEERLSTIQSLLTEIKSDVRAGAPSRRAAN